MAHFVFSQLCVKVSASLTNVGSLAVRAFDLVNCSLLLGSSLPLTLVSKCCSVVVVLRAT